MSLPVRCFAFLAVTLVPSFLASAQEKPASPEKTIAISQTTLAAMIAATRENVNRNLADLAADGYIHIHGRTLTITNPIALRRLADRALQLQPPPNRPSAP